MAKYPLKKIFLNDHLSFKQRDFYIFFLMFIYSLLKHEKLTIWCCRITLVMPGVLFMMAFHNKFHYLLGIWPSHIFVAENTNLNCRWDAWSTNLWRCLSLSYLHHTLMTRFDEAKNISPFSDDKLTVWCCRITLVMPGVLFMMASYDKFHYLLGIWPSYIFVAENTNLNCKWDPWSTNLWSCLSFYLHQPRRTRFDEA